MSLNKDLVLGEISGKNNAIHAYDKIIWTIRSGYLTLLYGVWALIIKNALENRGNMGGMTSWLLLMLAVSLSLAGGAFIIDRSYMRRKFRVIVSLNTLMSLMLEIRDIENPTEKDREVLHNVLRVAGDADNKAYLTAGYKQEARAGIVLYLFSITSLIIGFAFGLFLFGNP